MFEKIKQQSVDFIVISEITTEVPSLLTIVEQLQGMPMTQTATSVNFIEAMNEPSSSENDDSYICFYEGKIIIKEQNVHSFTSRYYINNLLAFFPSSQVSFIRLTLTGSDTIVGGSLKVITNNKPTIWLARAHPKDLFTDFGNGLLERYEMIEPLEPVNRRYVIDAIEQFLYKNLNLTDLDGIFLHQFKKISFIQNYSSGVFDRTLCEHILDTFPRVGSDKLYSRAGLGGALKEVLKEFDASSMPLMKELKEQVLQILAFAFEADGFVLKKSKDQLVRKNPGGEDSISLSSSSYSHSHFELVVGTRHDLISKLETDFMFSHSFSSNSNYKNGSTIACMVNRALFGDMIASSYNHLALQLYQTIDFVRKSILPKVGTFQDLNLLLAQSRQPNANESVENFTGTDFNYNVRSLTQCVIAIVINDVDKEKTIEEFLPKAGAERREAYVQFFKDLNKEYSKANL